MAATGTFFACVGGGAKVGARVLAEELTRVSYDSALRIHGTHDADGAKHFGQARARRANCTMANTFV